MKATPILAQGQETSNRENFVTASQERRRKLRNLFERLQSVEIGPVLGASGGALVFDELAATDEIDGQAGVTGSIEGERESAHDDVFNAVSNSTMR